MFAHTSALQQAHLPRQPCIATEASCLPAQPLWSWLTERQLPAGALHPGFTLIIRCLYLESFLPRSAPGAGSIDAKSIT